MLLVSLFAAMLVANPPVPVDADLNDAKTYGAVISREALPRVSSTSSWDEPEHHLDLFAEGHAPYAFHTSDEERPWLQVDLGRAQPITGIAITNRTDGNGARTTALTISLSDDAIAWKEIATIDGPKERWNVSLLNGESPRIARYVRLTLPSKGFLHLSGVRVYGRGSKG